jgi:hypothetical protein
VGGQRRGFERAWVGEYGVNTVYTCRVSGKMIPVKTIPGMGGTGE